MKHNLLITSVFAVFLNGAVCAQQVTQTTKDLFNFGGAAIKANTVMGASEIAGTGGKIIGTQMLDSLWHNTTFKLYQKIGPPNRETDSIPSIPTRFDIFNNDFEIKVSPSDIRGLNGNMVHFFIIQDIKDRAFINLKEFRTEEKMTGFVEILASGRVSLLQSTQLGIIKPTYNVALSTGNKDTKIIKTTHYYFSRGRSLFKLGNSKKKILEALGDKSDDIETWLKRQDLDLKKPSDLAKVFEYYNSL